MTCPMRILTITSNDLGISWGPAIHFLELWNAFCELRPEAQVTGCAPSWTRRGPIVPTRFALRRWNVINVPSVRQMVFDARMALYLARHGRRHDVVYLRLSHWHPLQTVVLRALRLPFVLELNGMALEDATSSGRNRFLKAMLCRQERWLVRHARLSIAVSDGIAGSIRDKYAPRGPIVTIGNGVARQFFLPPSCPRTRQGPPTVIYVGTFTSWDGAADVVDLARHFPDVRFVMAGDGAARARLQKDAPANVRFTGKVAYQDLPDLYRSADAAIVLYEYERHRSVKVSSLKTLEYVASRLPVFTTAIPGQEYIEENGFGALVPEGGDVVEAFRRFVADLDRYAAAYAQEADAMYGRFGWMRTARETLAALDGLASSPSTIGNP